jgi:hypothetical protein
VWVVPLIVAWVVARWCRALQRAEQIEAFQAEAMHEPEPAPTVTGAPGGTLPR